MQRIAVYLTAIGVCIAVMLGILHWPRALAAPPKQDLQGLATPAQSERTVVPGSTSPSAGVGPAAAGPGSTIDANQSTNVLDVARLVLETTRDQAAGTNSHIERASTLIVVFFTALGAAGAIFGWYRLHDIKATAESEIQAFRTRLSTAETEMEEKRKEFQASLDTLTIKTVREINAQSELMAARVQMDQVISNEGGALEYRNKSLRDAMVRITDVLDREKDLSMQARARGLADKAYAAKRLGETGLAYEAAVAAAELVDVDPILKAKMRPLSAFNAACYAAMLDRPDEALRWLREAISLKPDYKAHAQSDPDFKTLHEHPEFRVLVQ